MNRYSIFVIGVLALHLGMTNCVAQDTLFYKNGNLAVGHIVDIDSASGKAAFQIEESTRVVLFSTLQRVGFDGNKNLNSDFFSAHEEVLTQAPKTGINTKGSLLGKTKFTYNNWLIQVDLFSPLKKESWTYPDNSNVGIGIEYFFSDRFSLSVLGRFGTNIETHSTDTIDITNNYYPIPYFEEMDHEFEIATRFYPFGQRKFAPYFTPCISFGKFIYYHRKDFSRYYETDQDSYSSYAVLLDRRSENYFEWGGAAGLLMNLTRSINLSTQLIFVSTNATSSSSEYYADFNNGGVYELYGIYDDRYRIGNVRFQVFLVCRFGGKRKE
ncbi:MAG: hypothetical protein RIA62_00750 [Cyclobacteriaceae bacterium]